MEVRQRIEYQRPPHMGQKQKKKGFNLFKKKSKNDLIQAPAHMGQHGGYEAQHHHVMHPGMRDLPLIYQMGDNPHPAGKRKDHEHSKSRSNHHRSSKPPKSATIRSEWDIQTQTVSLDATGRNYNFRDNSGTVSTAVFRNVMNVDKEDTPPNDTPIIQNKVDQIEDNLQSKSVVDLRTSESHPDPVQSKEVRQVLNGYTHSTRSATSNRTPVDWGDAKYRYNQQAGFHELHVSEDDPPQGYDSTAYKQGQQVVSPPQYPPPNRYVDDYTKNSLPQYPPPAPNRYVDDYTKTKMQYFKNQEDMYGRTHGGPSYPMNETMQNNFQTTQHNTRLNNPGHSQNYPPRPKSVSDLSEFRHESGWNVQHVFDDDTGTNTHPFPMETSYQAGGINSSHGMGGRDPRYPHNSVEMHVDDRYINNQSYTNYNAVESARYVGSSGYNTSGQGLSNYVGQSTPYIPNPVMAPENPINPPGPGSATVSVKRGMPSSLNQPLVTTSQAGNNNFISKGYGYNDQSGVMTSTSTMNNLSSNDYYQDVASANAVHGHYKYEEKQPTAQVTVSGSILVSGPDDLDSTPPQSVYGAPSQVQTFKVNAHNPPIPKTDRGNIPTGSVSNNMTSNPPDEQWESREDVATSEQKTSDAINIPTEPEVSHSTTPRQVSATTEDIPQYSAPSVTERPISMSANVTSSQENFNQAANQTGQMHTSDLKHNRHADPYVNSMNTTVAPSEDIPAPPTVPPVGPPAPPTVPPVGPPAPPPVPPGGIPKRLTRIESEPAPSRPNRFLQDQGHGQQVGRAGQGNRQDKDGTSMGELADRIARMARERAERMGTVGDHLAT